MEGVVTSFGFKDDSVSNLGKGNFFRKSLRVLNSLYFFPAKFVGNTNEFKESALSSPSWKKKIISSIENVTAESYLRRKQEKTM